ncbi:MFS transporter [Actinokineospora bangkokensis]|uniref:MFS transporter n=2 Tax=Actinokineospora bangkokensis TaxID=1193682 RepID=A0A1Q9LQH9_9PSEU|nr:MFS transporter [Actinokineospora bangkokensis]
MGSLATGSFGTVPGLLLLPFLTDELAVPAAVAGVLVLLPKAWDVLLNPVAGRISDASRHPLGPRRPFLLRAGLALAVLFALMFLPPLFGSPWLDGGYVTALFLLCATAFAFFQVPFNAMTPELTADTGERTRLTAWRIAVLAVAILLSGAGAPLLRDAFDGYRAMGVAVGALIAVGVLSVYFGTKDAPVVRSTSAGMGYRELFAAVRGAPVFRVVFAGFVVQAVGIGTLLAGVDYVARVVLRDPGAQTLLFAAFVAPALVVMPLWRRAAARWGIRAGWLASTALFALALLGAALLPPTPVLVALVACCGMGYAGLQVFPITLLAEIISAEERRTGGTRAGAFSGVWTAGETLGLALGPGVFGLVLALGGYRAGADPATQPGSAATAITLGFSVLPAALVLATLPLLRRAQAPAASEPGE